MKIYYEDDDLLVVEKSAGIPTLSLKDKEEGTLAAQLIKKAQSQVSLPKGRLEAGIVHRLDNDTSGLVVAAKTKEAYEDLRRQFSNLNSVIKEYEALVVGCPPASGKIETPVAHHPRKKHKMVVCESKKKAKELKARPAVTCFKVIKRYKYMRGVYTWLQVRITTGVRHQIRAHLASIGFPLAGDMLYQNAKKRREDKLNLKRHFLHASRLEFRHPTSGKRLEFVSPVEALTKK